MKFLRELLEDLETLSVYVVEVFDRSGAKVGETKVIAANEAEATRLAVSKMKREGVDAVDGDVVDIIDIEAHELAA